MSIATFFSMLQSEPQRNEMLATLPWPQSTTAKKACKPYKAILITQVTCLTSWPSIVSNAMIISPAMPKRSVRLRSDFMSHLLLLLPLLLFLCFLILFTVAGFEPARPRTRRNRQLFNIQQGELYHRLIRFVFDRWRKIGVQSSNNATF
jgi:hypothetical protein